MSHTEKNVSIIIPTFREAKNIPELVQRIANVNFGEHQFEVILMDDDSRDGIVETVNTLSAQYSWLKIRVRKAERSLSQAVMEGFQQASFPFLVCMDADLSHPPEKIPEMLALLASEQADFVIGSRYVAGGSADAIWPLFRKISSRAAALIANLVVFNHGNIKDPLSGFFAVRQKNFLAAPTLNPIGWKIGLEMMVKLRCRQVKEIPIHFSERLKGRSKFSVKVMMSYLRHVGRLARFRVVN